MIKSFKSNKGGPMKFIVLFPEPSLGQTGIFSSEALEDPRPKLKPNALKPVAAAMDKNFLVVVFKDIVLG